MNRFLKAGASFLCVVGWGLATTSSAQETKTGETKKINPVWATVIQHVEEMRGRSPNLLDDRELYLRQRQAVVEIAKKIKELGFYYDFESDWLMLAAIKKYDDEEVSKSTNGKNLVRWLKEDMEFDVDPHAHESEYNYADVAYLIDQLGVKPSAVAGGFIYMPLTQTMQPWWDRMRVPINGSKYPDYTWKCEILWGAATGMHAGPEELYASGVWRPKSREEFTVDDPNGNLVEVGHYQNGAKGVIDLVERLEKGEVKPADGMWTASVFAGHGDLEPGSERLKNLFQNLESLVPLTKEGKIKWAGVTKQVEIWKTQYGAKPTFYLSPVKPERPGGEAQKAKGERPAKSKEGGPAPR